MKWALTPSAVSTYSIRTTGRDSSEGRLASEPLLRLGRRGRRLASISPTANAPAPIAAKLTRQPALWPSSLPSGMPSTIASVVPITSSPKALCWRPLGAIRTASEAVTDQNSACASATSTLEASSTSKRGESTDTRWPSTNSANTNNSRPRRSQRRVSSISGSEASATIHAYTVIITPMRVAGSAKDAPMSLSMAIGINSVVLKIKAAQASAATPAHERRTAASAALSSCSGAGSSAVVYMMCVYTDGKRRDYNGTFPPGAAGICRANGKNRFQAACCPRLPQAA